MSNPQIVSAIIGIIIGSIIFWLVRRDHMVSKDGISWLVVAAGIIIYSFIPKLNDMIGALLGIGYPPIIPVLLGMGAILIKLLLGDIEKANNRVTLERLVQRIAILEAELDDAQLIDVTKRTIHPNTAVANNTIASDESLLATQQVVADELRFNESLHHQSVMVDPIMAEPVNEASIKPVINDLTAAVSQGNLDPVGQAKASLTTAPVSTPAPTTISTTISTTTATAKAITKSGNDFTPIIEHDYDQRKEPSFMTNIVNFYDGAAQLKVEPVFSDTQAADYFAHDDHRSDPVVHMAVMGQSVSKG